MSNLTEAVAKVRRGLGDFGQPFTSTFVGLGADNGRWDLIETRVTSATVLHLSGGVTTPLVESTDFTIDSVDGTLNVLRANLRPLPEGDTLIVSGQSAGMFVDSEIEEYVHEAFVRHSNARSVRERIRDQGGFIKYIEREMTFEDLPEAEVPLVAMLATIEALWDLSTDASLDVDVHTPDGTSVPRSQRYAQMRNQITVLEERYNDLCAQMNVGLHRMETLNLRRTSRQTGRLVPVWESREYDDTMPARRILPPIDNRNADESDIPSSLNAGWGW